MKYAIRRKYLLKMLKMFTNGRLLTNSDLESGTQTILAELRNNSIWYFLQ